MQEEEASSRKEIRIMLVDDLEAYDVLDSCHCDGVWLVRLGKR